MQIMPLLMGTLLLRLVIVVVKEDESFLSWIWSVEMETLFGERRAVAVKEVAGEEHFVGRSVNEEKED